MNSIINWKSLTLLITIIGIIIPIYIWKSDLNSKSIQLSMISQTSLQPDNISNLKGLKISINNIDLISPYLTVFNFSNNGDRPIIPSDFDIPFEIQVSNDSKIMGWGFTATPESIQHDIKAGSQSLKIQPLLLNQNDVLAISIFTSGKKPEFKAKSRFTGMKEITIKDDSNALKDIWTIFYIIGIFLLFMSAAIAIFEVIEENIPPSSGLLIFIFNIPIGAIFIIKLLNDFYITSAINYTLSLTAMFVLTIFLAYIYRKIFSKIQSHF